MTGAALPSILVTGGCGFIGQPLVGELLANGHRVAVVDDLSKGVPPRQSGGSPGELQIIRGSVVDSDLIRSLLLETRPSVVVHLAAIHYIPECNADPERCIAVNVAGTYNLLRASAALHDLPRFILASSAAVYQPRLRAHRESDEAAPMDLYGMTKLWCEQLVRQFNVMSDVPAAIARLFNVYGPHETSPHLIPSLIVQAASSTRPLLVGDLSTQRDYIYVGDVVRALRAMIEFRLPADQGVPVFNVGSGEVRSGWDVVDALAAVTGKKLEVADDPSRRRSADRPVLLANVDRARKVLGWAPIMPFDRGLAAAVEAPLLFPRPELYKGSTGEGK